MAGSTSNLKVVGAVQNIGGGGGLNIIGKYPDDIDKAKPGDALIDEDGNIWVNDGTTWIQVDAVKGEDGKDGTNGVDGKDGVGVPEGGQDGQVLVKVGTEDYETTWGDVEFSSNAGNLVELNPVRKALRKPKDGEEVVLPLGRVVMYVGNGLPSDWPEITNAKIGSLFTSTTGDGFFFRDNDGWGIVGGSDDAPELPDDLVTQEDLEGLATEEYVDTAIDGIDIPEVPDDLLTQEDLDGLATEQYVDDATVKTLEDSKAYTDEKIAEGVGGEINLDGYATSVEVSEGDAKTLEDANAYTDTAVGNIDIPEVPLPDDLVKQEDLEGLATEDYVDGGDLYLEAKIDNSHIDYRVFAKYDVDFTNTAYSAPGIIWPTGGSIAENQRPENWTHINVPTRDLYGRYHENELDTVKAGDAILSPELSPATIHFRRQRCCKEGPL